MPYCEKCGASLEPNAQFCPSCGAPVTSPATSVQPGMSSSPPPPPPGYETGGMPPGTSYIGGRPLGITILAILEILGGLALLAGGAGLAAAAAFGVFGFGFAALGGLLVILGLLSFVVAFGLWTGRGWALTIGMILAIISVITNIVSIASGSFGSIFGLIIALIIIYYLTRPHVRAFFHRGPGFL